MKHLIDVIDTGNGYEWRCSCGERSGPETNSFNAAIHGNAHVAAADLAALRAENAKLRQIIADMLAYAQGKTESELLDSDGRIVIRIPLDAYRAALA